MEGVVERTKQEQGSRRQKLTIVVSHKLSKILVIMEEKNRKGVP